MGADLTQDLEFVFELHQLPLPGKMIGLRHDDRYFLIANLRGEIRVIDDWCNHAGCLLSEGHLDGEMVICPCHLVGFSVEDGSVLTEPAICHEQEVFDAVFSQGVLRVRRRARLMLGEGGLGEESITDPDKG